MKTIKILIVFAAFILNASPVIAQDTTKQFSFPHKVGDMWQYFFDDYTPYGVDTLQNIAIFDSTDVNGIVHIKQHARFINPTQSSVLIDDTTIYRIDTVNNYVYGKGFEQNNDSALIYKLNAKQGDQWIVNRIGGGQTCEIARVESKYEGKILGKTTSIMLIHFFITSDTADTTGLDPNGYDMIADGFGLVYRGAGELIGEIHIIGAVINGILYGDTTLVSVKDKKNQLPSTVSLYQNYPNPFNPSTNISFSIPKTGFVSIKVYDILGKDVSTLVNKVISAGDHEVAFNGSNLSSGIYFYRIQAGSFNETKKLILLK